MNNGKYFATMVYGVNDPTVRFMIVLINGETLNVIDKYKTILDKDNDVSLLSINHVVIDASVIMVSSLMGDFITIFKGELNAIHNKIDPLNPITDISDIMDDTLFDEWMFEREMNLAENTQLVLTEQGFYFTNQWDFDFIESPMFDYDEVQ